MEEGRRGLAPRHVVLLVALLVLVLLVGGFAAWRLDLLDAADDGRSGEASGPAGPAAIPPPAGLELPLVAAPPAVDVPLVPPGPVDPALVSQAMAPYLADPALGPHVVAHVVDLADPAAVVEQGDGAAAIPASVTKLLTTTAALSSLGPETRFATRTVLRGERRVVLVGGGDPFLASTPPEGAPYPERADLQTLAGRTAAALLGAGRSMVRLGYDDSLFSGPPFNPAWPAHYGPENVVSPVTALWADEGRARAGAPTRVEDPSLAAAQVFAAALTAAGVQVVGDPAPMSADGAQDLAAVESAPLREIVQHVLEVSDNEAAEVLSHQVGLAVAGTGSFTDGAAGVLTTLDELGVRTDDVELFDGSGLSREDRIPPAVLVDVLHTVLDPDHPELGAVAAGLPVAGFSGSLTNRFAHRFLDARGLVRAKTGTLSNVSSLAGIAVDQDGHAMLFALMADQIAKVDETKAQIALDAAAGALGACRCGSAPG